MFAQLAVVFVAVLGLNTIVRRRRFRLVRSVSAACLGLLAMIEVLPASQVMYSVRSVESQQGWIRWLARETPTDATIVVIPFPEGTSTKAYENTTLDMYWQTFHHRTMVNGYSGFFPESFRETKSQMQGFPNDASIERLQELGVEYCVIQGGAVPREWITEEELSWVFRDDAARIDIYRLAPP